MITSSEFLLRQKCAMLKDFNQGGDRLIGLSALAKHNSHVCCLMLISSMSKMTVPRVEPSPFARRVGLNIVVNNLCRSKNCDVF